MDAINSRNPVTSMNPQPLIVKASLNTLSPEILLSIFEYIPPSSHFSLLLICKSIYPTAHELYWSDIEIDSESKLKTIKQLYSSEAGSLNISLGWRFTKQLTIEVLDEEVADILAGLLDSGELKPQLIGLVQNIIRVSDKCPNPPAHSKEKFGAAIRAYYQTKPLGKIDIVLLADDDLLDATAYTLDFERLTKLAIDSDIEVYAHPNYRVVDLTFLLGATPNLTFLHVNVSIKHFDDDDYESAVKEDPEVLQNFQEAISRLERLEKLDLTNLFRDRSFFLIPPANVKTLLLECTTTPSWWVELSKCPLPKVEHLGVIHKIRKTCCEDPYIWSQEEYKITSVAVTTLKRFTGKGPLGPEAEFDFASCILEANKGLNGKHDFEIYRGGEIVPYMERCAQDLISTFTVLVKSNLARQTWGDWAEEWETDYGVGYKRAQFAKECISGLKRRAMSKYWHESLWNGWDRSYSP
ncbi:hypothetical protein TWF730_000208 [Orbilia blumenaviensis]|uniref:F-box domain-containing protein n=1 Tax=Orbilia blumenaviensis TaxID=1796055 RepID=A0AAV9VN41_9PEZI